MEGISWAPAASSGAGAASPAFTCSCPIQPLPLVLLGCSDSSLDSKRGIHTLPRSGACGGSAVFLHGVPLVPHKVLHPSQQCGGEGVYGEEARGDGGGGEGAACGLWFAARCGKLWPGPVQASCLPSAIVPALALPLVSPSTPCAPPMNDGLPPQVLKLLRRRERWLVVAAVRFLRTAVGLKVRCRLASVGLAGQGFQATPSPCPARRRCRAGAGSSHVSLLASSAGGVYAAQVRRSSCAAASPSLRLLAADCAPVAVFVCIAVPQDEFYNRYLVKNHLLGPVVAAFLGGAPACPSPCLVMTCGFMFGFSWAPCCACAAAGA
jgi:hypothetical protein